MAGRHAHHHGGSAARAGRDLRDGRPVQRRDGDNHGGHGEDNEHDDNHGGHGGHGGDNEHGGDNNRSHGGRLPGRHRGAAPANGFVTNPSRAQGGHLWWHRSADGGVCIGTVIMWVRYNTAAAKTWRVIVYSARHPGGLTVASRTFTLERGWYWRGFGVHRSFQDLSAVCVTATESFGMSCVRFSAPAG